VRGGEIELREIIEGEVNWASSWFLDSVLDRTVNMEPVLELLFRSRWVGPTRDLLGDP